MRFARSVLVVLVFCSTVVTPVRAASLPGAPAQPAGSFKAVDCSAFALAIIADRCGYLVVPEDWARPHGRTVQLAVAVFKSTQPHPAPDAVMYLNGGPGGATLATMGPSGMDWQQIFGNRDFILVDQRGTGFSRPSLACPEMNREELHTLDRRLNQPQAAALAVQATRQCHDRLAGAGVDLSAYTTVADAADIAALGPALGYKTVNLWGGSYGTRRALTVMRLYPAHVRSVILDSVVPPQINGYSTGLAREGLIYSAIMAACAASPYCSTHYPHLATTLSALVTRLNAHPAAIQVTMPTLQTYNAVLTGDRLWDELFLTLYYVPGNADVPGMIAAASRGDYGMVGDALGQTLAIFNDPAIFATGLELSVMCSEDAPYASLAQMSAAVQSLPAVLRAGVLEGNLAGLQECRAWHVTPLPAWQKTPVHSTIPTLVLTGQFDAATPPSWGKLAASTLPRSFFFTFPGQAHGQIGTSCPQSIATAFLQHPLQRPDASCIASMPPLYFN